MDAFVLKLFVSYLLIFELVGWLVRIFNLEMGIILFCFFFNYYKSMIVRMIVERLSS